jgi:hypothetical protein
LSRATAPSDSRCIRRWVCGEHGEHLTRGRMPSAAGDASSDADTAARAFSSVLEGRHTPRLRGWAGRGSEGDALGEAVRNTVRETQ